MSGIPFKFGGMVPGYGPVPAIVHGGEMILNREQQGALGAGGGNNFHYHQTIAGNASADTLRDGQAHFEKSLKRTLRRMNR